MNGANMMLAHGESGAASSEEAPQGLGVAMGVDPGTDAMQTVQALINTLTAAASSGTPLNANDISVASAQIRNIGVDLSLMQSQIAALQAQSAASQAASQQAQNSIPGATAPTSITPAAAGFIALGALAVGGLGAWLIFGRKSGGGMRKGRHANPIAEAPRKRRRRRAR
jgi:hypothetical protein